MPALVIAFRTRFYWHTCDWCDKRFIRCSVPDGKAAWCKYACGAAGQPEHTAIANVREGAKA